MQYRDFQDKKLSALGLGCMRLPTINGQYGNIDKEATAKILTLDIMVIQASFSLALPITQLSRSPIYTPFISLEGSGKATALNLSF